MATEGQTILAAFIVSATSAFGAWYATRAKLTEVNSSEAQSLLRMLMEERTAREAEMRALRLDIEHLREQNDRLAEERVEFAEKQQVVRHDLKANLRAANMKIEDQALEIIDLRERIAQLENLK